MSGDGEGVTGARPYLRVDAEQLTVLADVVASNAKLVLTRLVELSRDWPADSPGWAEFEGRRSEPYALVQLQPWLAQLLEELLAGSDMGLVLVPDSDPEVPDYAVAVRPRTITAGGC